MSVCETVGCARRRSSALAVGGSSVGEAVGSLVGEAVGSSVGEIAGSPAGEAVGSSMGEAVGLSMMGEGQEAPVRLVPGPWSLVGGRGSRRSPFWPSRN